MSYARGPTLRQLLDKGGALGLPLCRLVARDLISAVAHLHAHAVIHRDIKPDNCILAQHHPCGTLEEELDDNDIYGYNDNDNEDYHSQLGGKFRLVLIDFGFARALSPAELEESKRQQRQQQSMKGTLLENNSRAQTDNEDGWDVGIRDLSSHSIADALQDVPRAFDSDDVVVDKEGGEDVPDMSSSFRGRNSQRRQFFANSSRRLSSFGRISSTERIIVRGLSSLGTEAYAAPEIKDQARDRSPAANKRPSTVIQAMTDCVADYGMAVDAYSVGATLREILSGVPPNRRLGAADLDGGFGVWKIPFSRARRRGRSVNQIPTQAIELVQGLTRVQVKDRLTIWEARKSGWIVANKYEGEEENHEDKDNDSNDKGKETQSVLFLKCVQN